MSLLRLLDRLDKAIFVVIHNDSDAPRLDGFMLVIRNPIVWIPLYAFLLYYSIRKAGARAWEFSGRRPAGLYARPVNGENF